jgi:hypothetical protein
MRILTIKFILVDVIEGYLQFLLVVFDRIMIFELENDNLNLRQEIYFFEMNTQSILLTGSFLTFYVSPKNLRSHLHYALVIPALKSKFMQEKLLIG